MVRKSCRTKGWQALNLVLGEMYRDGKGVGKDHKQAVYWYTKAKDQYKEDAERGSASSQYKLGEMYEEGKGVTKDNKQAIYWYQKAADQGHEDAKVALEWLP